MEISRRFRALLALTVLALQSTQADVVPAFPFQDHAVLQQGGPVPLWGTADPGEKITVTYSAGTTVQSAEAIAKPDGHWRTDLPALVSSSQPGTLTFSGKNSLTLNDILVGEVWLASGQSNMEFALGWGNHVTNAQTEIASANHPGIRELKVQPASTDDPQNSAQGTWKVCTPVNVISFSAVAFFFARDLQAKLHVPIGIINAAYSGSMIEPFMTPSSLASDPNGPVILQQWKLKTAGYPEAKERYDKEKAAWDAAKETAAASGQRFNVKAPSLPFGPGHKATPSGSYNAMIHPLQPYALRGVIWYQGENNSGHRPYRSFFPALIRGWREIFERPDMPFYWAQLASWGANNDPDGIGIPLIREAQDMTLSVAHTGQAVTIDIGDHTDIHPHNKQDVGHRLARIALHRSYGMADMIDSGPVFSSIEFNAGAANLIRIHFKEVAGGLKNTNSSGTEGVQGFEVAGANKVFSVAEAKIEEAQTGTVMLTAPSAVTTPVFVRYAWHNDPKNSLVNSEGLPAAPFRSDPRD